VQGPPVAALRPQLRGAVAPSKKGLQREQQGPRRRRSACCPAAVQRLHLTHVQDALRHAHKARTADKLPRPSLLLLLLLPPLLPLLLLLPTLLPPTLCRRLTGLGAQNVPRRQPL
jgi:hypothetical protein